MNVINPEQKMTRSEVVDAITELVSAEREAARAEDRDPAVWAGANSLDEADASTLFEQTAELSAQARALSKLSAPRLAANKVNITAFIEPFAASKMPEGNRSDAARLAKALKALTYAKKKHLIQDSHLDVLNPEELKQTLRSIVTAEQKLAEAETRPTESWATGAGQLDEKDADLLFAHFATQSASGVSPLVSRRGSRRSSQTDSSEVLFDLELDQISQHVRMMRDQKSKEAAYLADSEKQALMDHINRLEKQVAQKEALLRELMKRNSQEASQARTAAAPVVTELSSEELAALQTKVDAAEHEHRRLRAEVAKQQSARIRSECAWREKLKAAQAAAVEADRQATERGAALTESKYGDVSSQLASLTEKARVAQLEAAAAKGKLAELEAQLEHQRGEHKETLRQLETQLQQAEQQKTEQAELMALALEVKTEYLVQQAADEKKRLEARVAQLEGDALAKEVQEMHASSSATDALYLHINLLEQELAELEAHNRAILKDTAGNAFHMFQAAKLEAEKSKLDEADAKFKSNQQKRMDEAIHSLIRRLAHEGWRDSDTPEHEGFLAVKFEKRAERGNIKTEDFESLLAQAQQMKSSLDRTGLELKRLQQENSFLEELHAKQERDAVTRTERRRLAHTEDIQRAVAKTAFDKIIELQTRKSDRDNKDMDNKGKDNKDDSGEETELLQATANYFIQYNLNWDSRLKTLDNDGRLAEGLDTLRLKAALDGQSKTVTGLLSIISQLQSTNAELSAPERKLRSTLRSLQTELAAIVQQANRAANHHYIAEQKELQKVLGVGEEDGARLQEHMSGLRLGQKIRMSDPVRYATLEPGQRSPASYEDHLDPLTLLSEQEREILNRGSSHNESHHERGAFYEQLQTQVAESTQQAMELLATVQPIQLSSSLISVADKKERPSSAAELASWEAALLTRCRLLGLILEHFANKQQKTEPGPSTEESFQKQGLVAVHDALSATLAKVETALVEAPPPPQQQFTLPDGVNIPPVSVPGVIETPIPVRAKKSNSRSRPARHIEIATYGSLGLYVNHGHCDLCVHQRPN
jgi:hypothetical protein